MTSLALVWDLIAKDGASPVFLRVAGSADKAAASTARAEKGLLGFGKKTVAALGAIGAITVGVKVLKDAAAFQKAMLLIQTQAGASADEVKSFSKAILAMSGQVATAPEELATSLYHVYSVGLRGAKALDVVRIAAEGAKVGNADLEETTNALTSTVASGIKGVQNMSQAMGALNAIVGSGDMKLSDLNDALGSGILAAARGFNVSLTQVGAALATFGDNNIRGADAATKLRMTIQDLAKPAAGADAVLAKIGLTSARLKNDLAEGGLTGALTDLKAHLVEAGISAKRIGPFIEEAFTKKAGVGLAILLNQMSRYNQKLDEVTKGAQGFGDAWQATTKTASFVFSKIGHQLEAFAISLALRALPAITSVANALDKIVTTVGSALGSRLKTIGSTAAAAFRGLAAALKPVASGLSSAFHFLNKAGAISDIATAVAALWVAFKGYTIAVAAFKAVQTAIVLTRVRMLELAASGNLGVAAVAGLVGGFYAAGKAISSWADRGKEAFSVLGSLKQKMDEWRDSLIETNGALNDNVRLELGKQLQDTGLAEKAAAAGISLRDLTDAVGGNDAAFKALITRWQASGKPSGDTLVAVAGLHNAFKESSVEAYHLAAATGQLGEKSGKLDKSFTDASFGAKNVAKAAEKLSGAFISAKDAAQSLDDALKRLSGHLTKREALDTYLKSLHDLRGELTKQNHTLDGNSKAAVNNRLAFDGVIHNMLDYAQTLKDSGAKMPKVRDALSGMAQSLIDNAKQYGLTSTQVRHYLDLLGLTPKEIRTKLNAVDLATPKIKTVQTGLANLHDKTVTITTNLITNGRTASNVGAQAQAAGTMAAFGTRTIPPNTVFTVGERGFEGGVSDSQGRVSIFSNSQSRAMGFRPAVGYAKGTGGGIRHVGDEYIYGGIRYASLMAAQNARTRAQQDAQASHSYQLSYGVHSEKFTDKSEAVKAFNAAAKMIAHQLSKLSGGELTKFRKAIGKTGSDVRSAFSTIADTLKQVGASHQAIHRLAVLDNKLAHKVDIRNRDMDRLQGLLNARKQLAGSIHGATVGSFDITSAGNGPTGDGKPTFGTIYAQALQDRNLVKKWAAGIRKLAKVFGKSGTGKAMLQRLAEAGPDSYPQVAALVAANPAQLRRLVGVETTIGTTGRSVGRLVGGELFNGRIGAERRDVHRDRQVIARETRALRHDLHELTVAIKRQPIVLKVDGKTIATAAAVGDKKNARRGPGR